MKLQGLMEKEPILRLTVFSASIFFILLVLPLHQDSSSKSTYNSHSILITAVDKVPKTDTEMHIYNSSASTVATSLTPDQPAAASASEKENNCGMLEASGKAVENVIEIEALNSSKVTIVSPDTPKEARLDGSTGEKNSQYRSDHKLLLKMGKSSIHDLSASISVPPSMTNKTRYCGSDGEKSFHNKRGAVVEGEDQMKVQLSRLVRGQDGLAELESTGISCSSDVHLDLCVINQPIILEKKSKSFTIYAPSSQNPSTKRVVRPYPKKEDQNTMMNWVAPVNIIQGKANQIKPPSCQVKHKVPALVFSFGGFTDNNFHKFSEVIIPLFITSRHFGSRVQFVVTDNLLGENWKFKKVLTHLSPYHVIDANEEGDKRVHCFAAAVVGLRYFGNLEVNSSDTPGGYTMADFKEFLRESYNLKVAKILKLKKPKVLLISRQKSRSLLNEDKIVRLMKKLGFQVQKVKPNQMSSLDKFAKIVNSCDVIVGVHGAGLTNQVFLPDGAVVVQIVPLGLEWASERYFAIPARKMHLRYLDYKIEPYESSLYDVYGPNNSVVSDPASIWARGFGTVKELYIDRQQIRVDITRFRSTLLEALKLSRE